MYWDRIVQFQKQPPRGVPRERYTENMQTDLQDNTHAEVLFQ